MKKALTKEEKSRLKREIAEALRFHVAALDHDLQGHIHLRETKKAEALKNVMDAMTMLRRRTGSIIALVDLRPRLKFGGGPRR